MTDNIKTISLAVIAVALFGHTIYKITADSGESASNSEVVQLSSTETADLADGSTEAEPEKPKLPPTSMTFKEVVYDFGEVNEGDKSKHIFEFTNTGKQPLLISNARGSCGCTVPSWPKEPIGPGESGSIEVEYNSKGKKGAVQQTITIDANTNPPVTKLTIKVMVNVEEDAEEPAS